MTARNVHVGSTIYGDDVLIEYISRSIGCDGISSNLKKKMKGWLYVDSIVSSPSWSGGERKTLYLSRRGNCFSVTVDADFPICYTSVPKGVCMPTLQ